MKGRGGLGPFREADPAAAARRQVVVDHYLFTVGLPVLLESLQAKRYADQPPGADETGVAARKRHRADDFSDAHGRLRRNTWRAGSVMTPVNQNRPFTRRARLGLLTMTTLFQLS